MIELTPSLLDLLLSHTGYGIGNEHPNQVKTIVIGNELEQEEGKPKIMFIAYLIK